MAETDLKIKDAPLSTNISGNAKMAGSDGSGLPVAISLSQVYNFVNSGLKGEAYFAAKTDIPTKVSSLINDSGFITSTALTPYLKKTELPTNVSAFTNDSGYLIKSDLAPYALASSLPTKTSELQNDSGYLSEETDPTVPSWAKQPNKPTYTASEVGALSEVPQATSEALGGIKVGYTVNDKNYPVQIDESGKAYVNVPWSGKATPVLASAPTEDTLTYMDSLGGTVNFEIGQSCVYPSEGSADGWYISFLKAINEGGKAVWERFDAINIATENANNAATLANQAAEAATASKNVADQAEELRATAETARSEAETARQEAETARANAEQTREGNEATRQSNETARQETESTRAAAEIERNANESTRQAQEAERQTNTATAIANAETATSSANTAAQNAIKAKEDTEAATALATELNDHPMIIQNDVWYKWNADTDTYENTGISAKGEKGDTGTVGIRLDAEPTEATLTYIVDDVTYNFELGMSAICQDSSADNGRSVYLFKGKTDEGKAIWWKTGSNYQHPSHTAHESGLYKITTDGLGHVSDATAVTKEDITSLGIPAQDTTYSAGTGLSFSGTTINHASSITAGTAGSSSSTSGTSTISIPYVTYNATGHITGKGNRTHTISEATTSASGLMSSTDKTKMNRLESYTTATTVASLDVNYQTIYVTLSENASLSASGTGTTYNGRTISAYVYTSSSVTITIPTSGNYVSMCGSSFTTTADGWVEFSLVCVNGVWHIAKLEAE